MEEDSDNSLQRDKASENKKTVEDPKLSTPPSSSTVAEKERVECVEDKVARWSESGEWPQITPDELYDLTIMVWKDVNKGAPAQRLTDDEDQVPAAKPKEVSNKWLRLIPEKKQEQVTGKEKKELDDGDGDAECPLDQNDSLRNDGMKEHVEMPQDKDGATEEEDGAQVGAAETKWLKLN